ncbi:hypothetical protein HDE_00852 [Halotydeus destructor]|nr:hypothetical protein HDE_00852 [Halotydeus destructor]
MYRLPEVCFSDLKVSDCSIESGRFGTFYKCERIFDRKTFILKSAGAFENPGQSHELMVHADLRRSESHDLHNAAEFFTTITYGVRLIAFPETMCSLNDYVQTLPDHRVTEREGIFMWLQVSNALNFLHVVNGLVHFDVNPENLCIRSDGNVLLGGFSKAHRTASDGKFSVPRRIPPAIYKHPMMNMQNYLKLDGRVDFWSLMMSVYRLVAGTEAEEFSIDSLDAYELLKRLGPLHRENISSEFRSWIHQYVSDSDEDFRQVYHLTTEGAVHLPPVNDVDYTLMYHGKCVTFSERMANRTSERG